MKITLGFLLSVSFTGCRIAAIATVSKAVFERTSGVRVPTPWPVLEV